MPRPFQTLRDFRLCLPNASFGNPRWSDASLRILVARLSPFTDVQRSTSHLFLAAEVRRSLPDAFIDVAFLPCEPDAAALQEAGLPLLYGCQSQRPLADFDLVLVSTSWVLEQVNLPFLLSRSAVPLWASARDEQWPAIVLGGSNACAAHALVAESGDCMADAIFFGEGENLVGRLAFLWKELGSLPKRRRIEEIARELTGLWPAGSLAGHVEKARASGPWRPALPSPILPGPEAATARLSITMGCPCRCSFCFEGFDRAPFREIPAEDLLRMARELKAGTGADTLEIESNNFTTHSELPRLLEELHRLFLRVNLMSQRVDILAHTPGLLDLEIASDKRGFTLGIEGISDRCRRRLHKSLAEEEIRRVLEALHARRTRECKLFYLLTGGETEDDLSVFGLFVKWLARLRARSEAPPRIVFSFGMLVRMPFTPLRHDPPLLVEKAWRAPLGRVKSACETNGFEFRLAMGWREYAATQALALGGHGVHHLLEGIARAGCVTDRGLTDDAWREAQRWIADHPELASEKPLGHGFGFPFLDDEATRRRLHGQYLKSRAGDDEGYCRHGVETAAACASCTTSCTRNPRRNALRDAPLDEQARRLRMLTDAKHRLKPVYMMARLDRCAAGMGSRWAGAWLMRSVLARHPGQMDNIVAVTDAFGEATGLFGDEVPWFGATVASVTAWDPAGLAEAIGGPDDPLRLALAGWDPGAVTAVRVRIELHTDDCPDPAPSLAAFLRDRHAPVTLSRSEAAWRFTSSEKSLKKRMLLSGACEESGEGHVLELSLGNKPFLADWLRTFGVTAVRSAVVEVREIATGDPEWSPPPSASSP